MKKLLLIILLILFVNFLPAQIKVRFTLGNRTISNGILSYTLYANVPVGQVWHVGSSNIRVTFAGNPAGSLSVLADNPADSANPNISNANGYLYMTTTPVSGGVAIGLNILTFITSGFYAFMGSPTPYQLGRIRFNITAPFYSDTMRFRVPPTIYPIVVYDSLVQLVYNVTYTTGEPPSGVEGNIATIPKVYHLYQNYPNPFNPKTNIVFDLAKYGNVKLEIYDISGKKIENLVNGNMNAGHFSVQWDASNYSSGVYIYRIETPEFSDTKKMMLIK